MAVRKRAGASARKVAPRKTAPRKKPVTRRKTAQRKKAAARPKTAQRKTSPPRAKTSRAKPRVAPYQSCTPEMEANIRHRYEETDEPIDSIAADRGVAPGSLRRIAYAKGWVRRKHRGPKDVTAAMRLLAEAERLEGLTLPLRSSGEGREQSERGGGSSMPIAGPESAATPPTPNPSPPLAPLAGGGEQTEPAAPLAADQLLATIARLEAAVRAELSTVEAMRAAYGSEPYRPYHAQLTTRTLSNLTDTLGKLARLRAALAVEPQPAAPREGPAHDDMPADIDEFRRELARRIEAFVASQPDDEGSDGDCAAVAAAPEP